MRILSTDKPVILTVEGEDFQNFTGHFKKPFDALFTESMQKTLKALCETMTGCALGYENGFAFTLVFGTDAVEEGDPERLSSYAASRTTLLFNRIFTEKAKHFTSKVDSFDRTITLTEMSAYIDAMDKGALFTAHAENVETGEVFSHLYHKQKVSRDHAVRQVGSLYFPQEELDAKNAGEIQFMIFEKTGINFEDYPVENRRGSACIRNYSTENGPFSPLHRNGEWLIDRDMPMLKEENKEYVERWLR